MSLSLVLPTHLDTAGNIPLGTCSTPSKFQAHLTLANLCCVFPSSAYIFFNPRAIGKVRLGEASSVTSVQLVASPARFTPGHCQHQLPSPLDMALPPPPPGQGGDLPAGPPVTHAPLTQLWSAASLAPCAPGGHTLGGQRLQGQVPRTVDELSQPAHLVAIWSSAPDLGCSPGTYPPGPQAWRASVHPMGSSRVSSPTKQSSRPSGPILSPCPDVPVTPV